MDYIFVGFIGVAMGSFINAFVWRLKEDKDFVKGRSICVHCKHQLAVKDLIPVISWLSLGGKCRYCSKPIHWQYPVVELLTAVLFLLSYHYWPLELEGAQNWLHFIVWLDVLVGLIAIAVYDIKYMEVPNLIIYPMIAVVMGLRFVDAIIFDEGAAAMQEMTLGLLVGGGFFLLLFYLSKGRWIGGGDVKLGFFFGTWLGPQGALVALLVGFYSAFAFIVPPLLLKKLKRGQRIPFGPFLIAGVIVATLFTRQLVDWYSSTLI